MKQEFSSMEHNCLWSAFILHFPEGYGFHTGPEWGQLSCALPEVWSNVKSDYDVIFLGPPGKEYFLLQKI